MSVGERLFAQNGVDRVSLAEINAAAQQRNASAVHYHFKGKDGLVAAILDRRRAKIERVRTRMLDQLLANGQPKDLDDLIHALVDPMLECLDDESGRCFLRIQAQDLPGELVPAPGVLRVVKLIAEVVGREMPPTQRIWHRRFVGILLSHALATRASDEDANPELATDRSDFSAALRAAIYGAISSDPELHGR